ncbi:hypothetical protein ZYGR_0I01160 [Zygosaccharomyces rouxii]|uniref:ZYRO0C02816p n=2 Tax=Zygosaccharomyces rouxii TaxID=4956 RepID=C5DST3_ZYGRC|nr:uncharacterized protein ZYRO0C02816g [Zygosaccharomyces rouxii]KAH9201966.1 KRI1-like family C-terminal-domain-containing protein [Zygosaccharomyces rouxii]GAV47820.1 hypothetical protein ZYGR_0I01160 [Zygosaccharomyces rouxii]CAR26844.1 ZYRO0C02816p [Zygosaccharomyces rouxii]
MPRKKSAAKRAREAEVKEKQPPQEVEKPQDEPVDDAQESENESSSSEEEDEYGELVTEDVEEGINKVLSALRSGNTQELLNPEAKFFEDPEKAAELDSNREKHKPIYLKDYHRMNILSGHALEDDENENANENGTVDGKQSYASQQNEEKSQLLKEINEAFDGDEEDKEQEEGDDMLVKKEHQAPVAGLKLPDPEENGEEFLKAFDSKQAWIPHKGDKFGTNMEEDDEAFDNAVENFENAYNFRFEDPNAANIISYARTQATLRRSDTTARRRKRDEVKLQKQLEKEEKEKALHKRKTEKVRKLTDVLEQLQKEYGKEIDQDLVKKITDTLMNSDFKVDEWDRVIGELFDSEFYSGEGKPTWDEDDEIMGDFYKEKEEDAKEQEEEERSGREAPSDVEEPPKKKAKKEKQEKKKSKKQLHEAVETAVDNNKLSLIDEVEEERKPRARTKEEQDLKFRYREVSPESFGLTSRDIFAADDSELNKYIGLKKFAPYRAKELRNKDKRKAAKPRRLKEWRKEVFHNEEGPLLESSAQGEQSTSQKKSSKKHKHK